jgi:DNA-binding transcriptional LysR family regulator
MLAVDLQYFLSIARHRSLARAADELTVSQPALSRAVQRLEIRFAIKLFERTPRGMELTDAGRRLAHHARNAEIELDEAARELTDMSGGKHGHVRVAAGHTISSLVNSALVPRLHLERPAATLHLDAHFNDRIVALLAEGAYDFAVGVVPESLPESLVAEVLMHDELVPAVHESHPLAHVKHPTVQDLVAQPWTGAGSRVLSYAGLEQLFISAGQDPPRYVVDTNSYEIALAAVRRSLCVTFAPKWLVRSQSGLFAGLVTVDVPGFALRRDLGLLWRKGGYLSPIAERVFDLVKTALQEASADERRK